MSREDKFVAAAEPISMTKPPSGDGRLAAIIVAVLLVAIVAVGVLLIAFDVGAA